MKNGRLIAEVVLLVSTTVTAALPANAQQKSSTPAQRYVYCWAANLNAGAHISDDMSTAGGPSVLVPQKSYYSDVFAATVAQKAAIQNAFTKYLLRTYPNDNTGPARCGFYSSEDEAQGQRGTGHTDDNDNHRQIVDTGWAYGSASPKKFVYCEANFVDNNVSNAHNGAFDTEYVSKVFPAASNFLQVDQYGTPMGAIEYGRWVNEHYRARADYFNCYGFDSQQEAANKRLDHIRELTSLSEANHLGKPLADKIVDVDWQPGRQ